MTTVQASTGADLNTTWKTAPTHTIKAGGVEFAYRELGPRTGVPVVFLTHLAAVLDNWTPESWMGSPPSIGSSPSTTEVSAPPAELPRDHRGDGQGRLHLHPRPRL